MANLSSMLKPVAPGWSVRELSKEAIGLSLMLFGLWVASENAELIALTAALLASS